MRCPFCREDKDRVVDSRVSDNGLATRRRRHCVACNRRYTTYERIEKSPLKVVKKDGSRVPYEREKLQTGIELACRNLPISADVIENVVDRIENEIFSEHDREVPSTFIGGKVMEELGRLSQVAYVRFASVYREFTDITSFTGILEELRRSTQSEQKRSPPKKSETRQSPSRRSESKRGGRRGPDRKD